MATILINALLLMIVLAGSFWLAARLFPIPDGLVADESRDRERPLVSRGERGR